MSDDDLALTLSKQPMPHLAAQKEKYMAKSKVIRIAVLDKPGKRSGNELLPGSSTVVAGLLIVNQNATSRWVDRQSPKRKKARK